MKRRSTTAAGEVKGFSLFASASKLALGRTQPPVQWVSEALSPRIKCPGREVDHSPPSSKGKVVPVLNEAPRHEDVWGEWWYSSRHS
jgi:hypothetical protein